MGGGGAGAGTSSDDGRNAWEAASLVCRIATVGLSLASAIMTAASTRCVYRSDGSPAGSVSYSDYGSFKYSALANLASAVLQGSAIWLEVVGKEKWSKTVELLDKLVLALTSTSAPLLFAVDDITSCGGRRRGSRSRSVCDMAGSFCRQIRSASLPSLGAVGFSVAVEYTSRQATVVEVDLVDGHQTTGRRRRARVRQPRPTSNVPDSTGGGGGDDGNGGGGGGHDQNLGITRYTNPTNGANRGGGDDDDDENGGGGGGNDQNKVKLTRGTTEEEKVEPDMKAEAEMTDHQKALEGSRGKKKAEAGEIIVKDKVEGEADNRTVPQPKRLPWTGAGQHDEGGDDGADVVGYKGEMRFETTPEDKVGDEGEDEDVEEEIQVEEAPPVGNAIVRRNRG
ncbi:unnamed protein product [Urochloa humidicola]